MNVFDFDNTIYEGESAVDFFKYCVKRKPSLSRYLPKIGAMALKYKRGKVDKQEVLQFAVFMLGILSENMKDLDDALCGFWKKNSCRLKPDIIKLIEPGDVILSASPSFIFSKIENMLGGAKIISTQVDLEDMKILFLCYGENKVARFKECCPGTVPENYYTDNFNDMPMISFSKRAWLVRGSDITEIKV